MDYKDGYFFLRQKRFYQLCSIMQSSPGSQHVIFAINRRWKVGRINPIRDGGLRVTKQVE
jgi:hypothetical protein